LNASELIVTVGKIERFIWVLWMSRGPYYCLV